MNDQKPSIDGLNEIYRKTCLLADEIADKDESKKDADIRLANMFIKYAKMHNISGKFDQIYDDALLIATCERHLMHIGNANYFDDRLTAYRNNMELLHMLRDALKLLEKYEAQITFRKKDSTFLDRIHDGHMAELDKLDIEIEKLTAELDAKQEELSKFGFFAKRTIRKKDYIALEKEAKGLQEQKEKRAARYSALEVEYEQCHTDYHTYMQLLSSNNESKISTYFFSKYDEEFERIYGISNIFEANRVWLNKQVDAVINRIGADQNDYQRLQDMFAQAIAHSSHGCVVQIPKRLGIL